VRLPVYAVVKREQMRTVPEEIEAMLLPGFCSSRVLPVALILTVGTIVLKPIDSPPRTARASDTTQGHVKPAPGTAKEPRTVLDAELRLKKLPVSCIGEEVAPTARVAVEANWMRMVTSASVVALEVGSFRTSTEAVPATLLRPVLRPMRPRVEMVVLSRCTSKLAKLGDWGGGGGDGERGKGAAR
jgi:hypothetical protein